MKIIMPLVIVFFVTARVFSANYFVDFSQGSNIGAGTSWPTAKKNIQAAVDLATSGDVVWVTNGVYELESEISVANNISILGVNGAEETIVVGNASNRCFRLNSACLISGLKITSGNADIGGGIYCSSDASVVSNCIIANNTANDGGGMAYGTVYNCKILNNSATNDGGGIFYTDAYNSLICSNYSADYASAASHGEIVNCTVTENTCGNTGRLLSQIGIVLHYCDIKNTIVYYNPASRDNNQIRGSSVYNSCYSDASTYDVNGNISAAPDFTSDYHISSNSPCRSAGSAAYSAGIDLDGGPWLDPPSMGCYEVIGPIQITLVGPTNICVGTEGIYQVAVTGAVEELIVNFGDGDVMTNQHQIVKTWNLAGNYDVVVTGKNEVYPLGVSITQHVSVVNASIVYVSTAGNDSASGTSWANAKASIQAGIDVAANGGTVLVSEGLYSLTQSIHLSRMIKVLGGNDPSLTIVDAGDNGRVFTMTDQGSTLSGMTIRNGYNHIDYPPTPTYGGGIFCDGGDHVITNCFITGNTTGYGGGGVYGGTIYDSIISGNSVASQNGGGVHSSILYRCIIQNNSAGLRNGGGMYGGYAENCLIKGNDAALGGGVSEGTVVNCTIINNHAGQYGGLEDSTAKNSIITDNSTDFYFPNFGIQDSTVISSCSPSVYHGSSGNITNTPLFIDELNGDYRLHSDSPCINSGNNTYVTTDTDKDGKPRILDGSVEMGAYEFGSSTIIIGYGPSPTGFEINWIPIVGYDSKVTFSTDLTLPFTNLSTIRPYPVSSYIDTAYGTRNKCYYKVELVPQP